jgi:hypothetical protein
MKLIKILPVLLVSSGVVHCSLFLTQKENLMIDEYTPTIKLEQYFKNEARIFGLVSDKTRSYLSGGYLCYAKNMDEF